MPESGKASGSATAGESLPSGVYIVKVRGKNGERSFKVIKQYMCLRFEFWAVELPGSYG